MKSTVPEVVTTDVLVIGGGCAGCWAAIRAKELTANVVLAEKGVVARSGTALYCHDVLAPVPEGEHQVWLKELAEHAEFMSDQRFAEIMLKEEGDRIRDMVHWGVPFERDEKGELHRSLGRGHITSRVCTYDGRKLMEVAKAQARRRGVDIRERIMITDLLTSDGKYPTKGRIVGAVGIHTQNGGFYVFKAKAVVVTTGMITAKLHFSYGDNLSGDGQAMAYRAGAELAGLEFNFGADFVGLTEGGAIAASLYQFQTQGAYLVNGRGERFMGKYVPDGKERRSTIGLITLAMAKEILEGRGPIYYDMRHFTPEHYQRIRRIIPITMAALDGANIDIRKERVPCRPMVNLIGNAGCGGIKTNSEGESNIPGLLAAGISAQFPGCAESLSGLKISACSVFGYRAGQQAARIAEQVKLQEVDRSQLERLKEALFAPGGRGPGLKPMDIYRRLAKKLVKPEYSIIKSEDTIKAMMAEATKTGEEDLPRVYAQDLHELIKAAEARNWVLLIEPVYTCALERKESRLTHYRRDYPYRDDVDWLKWVVVRREGDQVKVRHELLPVEEYPIKLPRREKIPATIQFSQ